MSAQSGWPTRMKNVRRTGCSGDDFSPPLRLAWKFNLGGYVWAGPVVSGGVAFLPFDRVYALDMVTGELVWKSEEVKAFGGSTSAAVSGTELYVGGIDYLFALNAQTGDLTAKFEGRCRDSSPCVHEGTVYWGTVDGQLSALDARTKEKRWSFDCAKGIRFTPSVHKDRVLFVAGDTLYILRPETGAVVWKWVIEGDHGKAWDTAAIVDDTLLLAVERLGLFALDAATGRMRWHYRTQYGPFTAPCVSEQDGVAYVASGRLHAVSIRDGAELWASDKFHLATSAPIVVGDCLFIGGGHSFFIYAFDRHTGNNVWKYPTGDMVFSSPAYADGRLVVGCHDGYVYCFEQA